MGHTVDGIDDYVVDIVLDVDSRGIGIEDLSRRICLPGMEILRTTAPGTIWMTALVTASGEAEAIRMVREGVLAQLPDRPRFVVATVVSGVPLGDLYARLGSVLTDEELGQIDLRDLIDLTTTEVDLRSRTLDVPVP